MATANLSASAIDLGFAEKLPDSELWRLNSKFFPSKVGGRPSWLALENLPSSEKLLCAAGCNQPLTFVLQIYAPKEHQANAFHRTIYLFCCNTSGCESRQFKAVRCQLERTNKFYAFDAPDYDVLNEDTDLLYPEKFGTQACNLCGCAADKKCAQCRVAFYCSKLHQTVDWSAGGHKGSCKSVDTKTNIRPAKTKLVFPELELVIEAEDDDKEDSDSDEEEGNVADYQKTLETLRPKCQDQNFENYVDNNSEDVAFNRFMVKVSSEKDQVIRYYRTENNAEAAQPLWVSDDGQASSSDIPNCEECDGARTFEFQVMPQLLNYFSDTFVDWGTMAIYTCKQNCTPKNAYTEEFVWKQDFK